MVTVDTQKDKQGSHICEICNQFARPGTAHSCNFQKLVESGIRFVEVTPNKYRCEQCHAIVHKVIVRPHARTHCSGLSAATSRFAHSTASSTSGNVPPSQKGGVHRAIVSSVVNHLKESIPPKRDADSTASLGQVSANLIKDVPKEKPKPTPQPNRKPVVNDTLTKPAEKPSLQTFPSKEDSHEPPKDTLHEAFKEIAKDTAKSKPTRLAETSEIQKAIHQLREKNYLVEQEVFVPKKHLADGTANRKAALASLAKSQSSSGIIYLPEKRRAPSPNFLGFQRTRYATTKLVKHLARSHQVSYLRSFRRWKFSLSNST